MQESSVFKSLDGLTDAQVKRMINWQSPTGLSPLHVAVRNTNFGHAQKLVSLGADCSLPDVDGNTPLHLAAECGNLEILNHLADSTDDLDLQNNNGETPVILACHAGHMGAFVALTSMDKHVVPADTTIVDSKGRNILMHACISGDMDLVRLILANREGNSQHLSIGRFSVNAEDSDGLTALMYCGIESQWHLIAILVANKANINSKDKKGRTALHWAAAYGDASTVSALIDCGAVVDDPDADSWSPLMLAVSEDNLEIAQLLIECHANPDHCIGLTKSRAMHIMLCDAVRDSIVDRAFYPKRQKPVVVDGRLIVTLKRVEDMYIDPSSVNDGSDDMIVYGVVQWKASGDSDDSEMISITAGVKADRSITWNESSTFFLRDMEISRSCILCIDLFATRNHEPISGLFNMQHAAGEDEGDDESAEARQAEMDFMHKQVQEYERKILGVGKTEKEAKSALNEFNFSDHKRRWNQLLESRKRLSKYYGINFPLPPVPAEHFPCGSVRLSYSRLRELFRPKVDKRPRGAISFARFPRFADKGAIHFEIDFVPSIFPHRSLRGAIDLPSTPRESDVGPVEAPEELFHPPADTAKATEEFATRAEKLATQSKQHYVRWWSTLRATKTLSLGGFDSSKRTFKQEEADLIKIVHIIARSMIK
jgi:ankyrin repeat protein